MARQIRNPVIEHKELMAFDLLASRREVLKGLGMGTLTALVGSSFPPTAWGRVSDDCRGVKPRDVGLTPAEMAAVVEATDIDYGTELFQDTIYAQPPIASQQVFKHGLIEGPRARMRVQSQLDDQTAQEESYTDIGFNFGPSELVQIEKTRSGSWDIVHYFHPWGARTDGLRTDGLERHVVTTMFTEPERVICITGSHTNEFVSDQNDATVAASYLVYIEVNNSEFHGALYAVGRALSSVESGEVAEQSGYPLTWAVNGTLNTSGVQSNFLFSDKYVSAGLDLAVPGDSVPVQATEHVIRYSKKSLQIISLDDITTPGKPILIKTNVSYPEGETSRPRVAHIEYNPVPGATGEFLQLSDFALVTTSDSSTTPYHITFYSNQYRNANISSNGYEGFGEDGLQELNVSYSSSEFEMFDREFFTSAPQEDGRPDYSSLLSVNGVASTPVSASGNSDFTETVHLKVGNFPGSNGTSNRGLCLFALDRVLGSALGADQDLVSYELVGDFPLALPDDAGVGAINSLSGGSSKFGGLRLFAGDDNGNLFMLRQQRLADISTPYSPPIYIQNDAKGQPATFSTTQAMTLPPTTAASSNLHGFDAWMNGFYQETGTVVNQGPAGVVAYNFLLNSAVGFGSDDSNVAQGIWLGSDTQAVYAPKRFAHDAEHMVVREVSDDGSSSQFNVFNVFNNIVEKTWVSRKIASQVAQNSTGLQESGDFYQATLYAANIYGNQVALSETSNPGMQIEIRADAPVTVIDLTNNKYYDVDRYTSFAALPDQASNQLRISVKAENFAQVIYARLLQADQLSPSSVDPAMLSADTTAQGAASDWVSINIAADGQARMSATGSTSAAPASECGDCDETVYVCSDSLCKSNSENNWQTKGGYEPSDNNLDSLSSYLNQSGQNLSDASSLTMTLALGAAQVDPLTSTTPLTADANRSSIQTTFDYKSGTISVGPVSTSVNGPPGDVFSSVGHALHDALHWLQHVEGTLYSSLANGVEVVIDDSESIGVSVAADIMKQVNGIDKDLNEVVSTVEEYGSVVVNVVVTIVESSFIYKFVELLIALISLFIYLENIKQLSDSLKTLIRELPDSGSSTPLAPVDVNFPWQEKLTDYVGSPNNVEADMGQANVESVVEEVVDGLLNDVLKNPFTRKLMDEVVSALSRAVSELDTSSPVNYSMDTSIIASQVQLFEDFAGDVDNLFVDVSDDAFDFLITQVVDDVENPRESYANFSSGLSQFVAEVDADAMDSVYTLLDQLVATDTNLISEMLNQNNFMELKIPLLADLFRLFNIGNTSGNTVSLGSGDAICFPMALIIWVAIFEATGKSTKDISQLIPSAPTTLGESEPGASANDKLAFANAVVTADLMTINGVIWTAMQTVSNAERLKQPYRAFDITGEWANIIRWTMNAVTTSIQLDTHQISTAWTNDYLPTFTYCRWVTAVTSFGIKVDAFSMRPIVVTAINAFLDTVAIVWSIVDAAEVSSDKPQGSDWALLVGNDVGRAGVFGKLLYAIVYGDDPPSGSENLPFYGLFVLGTATAGFGAAAAATGVERNVGATAPTTGCLRPSPFAISQVIDRANALPISLPNEAQCKRQLRLTRYLELAQIAYARGDDVGGVTNLQRFVRTIRALDRSGKISASDADQLTGLVEDMLACD